MKIEDLADAIEDELNIYAKGSAAVVKNAVKDTAKEIKDGIAAGAPVGVTGKYAKSWRVKKTAETDTSVSCVIHANKDGYRLAHLLEFGHGKGDRISYESCRHSDSRDPGCDSSRCSPL